MHSVSMIGKPPIASMLHWGDIPTFCLFRRDCAASDFAG
jgi:hypothetical protein